MKIVWKKRKENERKKNWHRLLIVFQLSLALKPYLSITYFTFQMRELQLKNKPASGVWCRADNYKKKKSCNRATGYARKLLPGIFKLSYIVKGTRSGQTCHSMDQYKNQDVLKLHPKAMDTMISKHTNLTIIYF